MNDFLSQLILALIQGVTEWFPISSSGHLVLASSLLGYENTLAFDLALHFGTLMAVFVYFGKDISDMARDFLLGRFTTGPGRTGIFLLIATVPAGLVGFFFRDFFEHNVNNLHFLAWGFAITGVLLLIAGFAHSLKKRPLTARMAFFIGCAQVASLFRGISRSGSTICAGVLLGLDQRAAARFSFLMSIPIIIGANMLSFGNQSLPPSYFFFSLISFVVGLASIHFLLKVVLVSRANLRWFGLYALLLAFLLFLFLVL